MGFFGALGGAFGGLGGSAGAVRGALGLGGPVGGALGLGGNARRPVTIGEFRNALMSGEAPVSDGMPVSPPVPMEQGPEFIGGDPPAPEPLPPDAQPSFAPDDFRQMPQPDMQMFGNQPQSAYGRQTLGGMAPGKFGQWWGSSFGRGGR